MTDWFFRDAHDRTVGPLRSAELLERVRHGDIQRETWIRKDDSQWVRSIEINGLFDAAARPETEFSCPVCSHAISKPPTRCPSCMKYIDQAVGKIKRAESSSKQLQKLRALSQQSMMRPSGNSTQSNGVSRGNVENSQLTPQFSRANLSSVQKSQQTSDAPSGNGQSPNGNRWWRGIFARRK